MRINVFKNLKCQNPLYQKYSYQYSAAIKRMDNSFDKTSFFFNNLRYVQFSLHNKNSLSCNQEVTSYKGFAGIMIYLAASLTWEVKFPLNIYLKQRTCQQFSVHFISRLIP